MRALLPSRCRQLTSGVPRHRPPWHIVRAPRADAPPYRQAETFSATRAASASAHSGRIFPTSRPLAAAPGGGRRRRRRRPGGGRPQRRPPTRVEEGEGEGMDMRERRSGQSRRRSLPVDVSATFVLSGGGRGASLAGGASLCRSLPRRRFIRAACTKDLPWSLSLYCTLDSLKIVLMSCPRQVAYIIPVTLDLILRLRWN